jgi:hypothetical protein
MTLGDPGLETMVETSKQIRNIAHLGAFTTM